MNLSFVVKGISGNSIKQDRPEFYIDLKPWNRVCGFTLIIIKFGKQDWEYFPLYQILVY